MSDSENGNSPGSDITNGAPGNGAPGTGRRTNGRRSSRRERAAANGQGPDVSPQHKAALLVLFVTFFVDILGFGLVLTLNPYYVERYPTLFGHRIGAGLGVGLLTACYPILQLICAPFWGRLSDRIGRRPIILLSLFGNGLAWLLFGVAQSLEVLFLARMLSGVLSSASLPTVQAYIADSTPPNKRSIWIGIVVGMGFSFGFMLGPPLGGLLATNPWPGPMNILASWLPGGHALINGDHLTYPAFLAATIALLNFIAAWRRLPESLPAEVRAKAATNREGLPLRQLARALGEPALGAMLVILGLSTFAMQNLEQNVILYGNQDVSTGARLDAWAKLTPQFVRGHEVYEIRYAPSEAPPEADLRKLDAALAHPVPGQPGMITADPSVLPGQILMRRHLIQEDTGLLLFIIAFIVGMIQGGALKRLVPRFGEVNLVIGGSIIAAIGMFLVAAAHTLWPLIGAASVTAVGFSFIAPCLRGLISQDTDIHSQGSVLGVSESVRGLAMASGPLIGGALFDWGAAIPFALAGFCMLAGGAFAYRLRSLAGRQAVDSAPETAAEPVPARTQ